MTEGAPPAGLVVLLHGLGRTSRSLRRLQDVLRGAGYQTYNWDYPGRRHSLADLVAMFRRRLATLAAADQRVDFVGHSLGALLIRGALAGGAALAIGRIVMIAPPNQGVRVETWMQHTRLVEWLYGRPARDLAAGADALAGLGVPDAEIGIIAGSRRFHPFNPTSYFTALRGAAEHHDGTIAVAATRLPGMADFLTVDATHTFICNDAEVARQTLTFLRQGRFDRRM